MKTHTSLILAIALLASLSSGSVNAALTVTISGPTAGANYYSASSTDLLNSGQSTFGSVTATTALTGLSSLDGLHDGLEAATYSDSTFNRVACFAGASGTGVAETFTFSLNLDAASGGSAAGYDITDIRSIAGWDTRDNSFQNLTIYYTTTTNSNFVQLGTANMKTGYQYGGAWSTQIELTDNSGGNIATGVTALKFVYGAGSINTIIQEIDVMGTPTVVPEPSTWAMIVGGLGMLAFSQRMRRQNA